MHQQQQLEGTAGSVGRRCDLVELEICGHPVFRLKPITVPVTDQAALAEGVCPNCVLAPERPGEPGRRVPLAGVTGTWCPRCLTYWPYDRAAVLGPAFVAAGGIAAPRGGAS